MTLNGVMAIILRYYAVANYVKGLISHHQIFSRQMSYSTLTKHDGRAVLLEVVELLG